MELSEVPSRIHEPYAWAVGAVVLAALAWVLKQT
jgi:hypothetical protein